MNLTKDLLAEFARSLKATKKTDPAVVFGLKALEKGPIDRHLAIRIAYSLLAKDSTLDIPSVCETLGHPEAIQEVTDNYSKQLSDSIPEKEESDCDSDPEAIAPTAPNTSQCPEYLGQYLSAYGHEYRLNATDFNSSDNCLALMALHCTAKGSVLKVRDLDKWYTWTGYKWKESCLGDIRLILDGLRECIKSDLAKLRYSWKYEKPEVLEVIRRRTKKDDLDSDKIEKIVSSDMKTMTSMIARLSSLDSKNSIAKTIGDHVMRDSNDLDQNKDSLVFKNATWSAKTNSFSDPDPKLLSTRCINLDWENPSKLAIDRFSEFLLGLGFDEETIVFLKRSFGYCSLGRGNAKRFWWFRGQRNTGKTSLTQLVGKSLDEYTEVTQTSVWLTKSGSRPGHTDDLAALRGSRMVICDEFPEVSRFDDSLLKQVTGGSVPMRASAKGEKGSTFRISYSLFFSSNFDPKISSEDTAALGRLTALTFKSKVKDINESFVDDFVSDPDNRRAILQWVMEGAVEYIREGFGEEPAAIKASREEFKNEQVSIQDQLRQILEINNNKSRPAKTSLIKADLVDLQKKTREHSAMLSTRKLHDMIKEIFGVGSPAPTNGDYRWDTLTLVSSHKPEPYDHRLDNWTGQQEFNEYEPN